METDGIRRRFELYADLLEDIHLQQVRLYARRQSASAPSSPSWDGMPGGVGVPGDRIGNAASAAVDLEREIAALLDTAAAEKGALERIMAGLNAREKAVIRLHYFDRFDWETVADTVCMSDRGARGLCQRAFEKLERMGL